jgi:hypothetical protein
MMEVRCTHYTVYHEAVYPWKGREDMTRVEKEDTLLQKDKNYVKFHRLLAKAEAEGRLDGKHVCPVCGMRFLSAKEADECCRIFSQ